ncbi:MAG: hypothetical protein R3F18_09380 [Lysobacterales bacterium]|nr:hypothetical protein [Xanthomonadales bacterium]MCP5474242.1 hypothetical protein [Rhodanobacteraceae bacterium]
MTSKTSKSRQLSERLSALLMVSALAVLPAACAQPDDSQAPTTAKTEPAAPADTAPADQPAPANPCAPKPKKKPANPCE